MNMIAPIDTTHAVVPDASHPPAKRWTRWQKRTAILVPIAIAGVIGVKLFDHSDAVAAAPAALLSKVAPAELRGEALGLLDASSSLARIAMPMLTGVLVERAGTTAPFWLMSLMSLAGVGVLSRGGGALGEARTKVD